MTAKIHRLAAATAAALLVFACASAHAKALRGPTQVFALRTGTALDARMDPALRSIVERLHAAANAAGASGARQGLPRAADFFAAYEPWQLIDAGGGASPEADVFVHLASGASDAGVTAGGGRVRLRREDLAIVRMPVTSIEAIAALPEVLGMSLSTRWSAQLDSSRVRSGAAAVQAGTGGLPRAYKGTGVIVGVLDSGIDYTHADFRTGPGTGPGTSRLKGLFDFAEGTDGLECRPGQLDSLTCPEIDGSGGEGHGTHVTGTAAGNGRLVSKYKGMAPEADILFVKGIRSQTSTGGFSDADIVSGAAWVFDRAMQLGKPAVLNLSLGGQSGPHDGSTYQEQILSLLTGPGRIIVASAGNSGGTPIHVGYNVTGTDYNSSYESALVLSASGTVVDAWAPATSAISFGLAAYDPTTLVAPLTTAPTPVWISNAVAPGQSFLHTTAATQGGTILADVSIDARNVADQYNGARQVQFQIGQVSGQLNPASLVWTIYAFGHGKFDMWVVGGAQFPPVAPAPYAWPNYFLQGGSDLSVGTPACGRRILCVGSHVTKRYWTDSNGVQQSNDGWYPKPAELDSVSFFSSRGPSRDGRILPDFTAPGDVIVSTLSKDCAAAATQVVQGGGYQAMQGTSMASPHVTGIVALMLQRDPYLTPENARAILQQTAIATDTPVPSNAYGSGRVDALAAVNATPDPLACVTIMPSGRAVPCDQLAGEPLSVMAYPNPAPRQVRLAYVVPTAQRVHLALYDVSGRRVRTLVDGPSPAGVQSAQWQGEDDRGATLASGVYFARLITASGSRSIRLVLSR